MNEILNIDGVAKYLGLSPSTVYKLCREGDLPHSRLGKQFKFSKSAIDKNLQGDD
jgi:excisionase family DNA binding protein